MKIGDIIDADEFYQFRYIDIRKKPADPNYGSPVAISFDIADSNDTTNGIISRRSYINYKDIKDLEFDSLAITNRFNAISNNSLITVPVLDIQLNLENIARIPHCIQFQNPVQATKREDFNFQRILNKIILTVDVNLIVRMFSSFDKYAKKYSAIAHSDFDNVTIVSYKEIRNRLKSIDIKHVDRIIISHDGFGWRGIIKLDRDGSDQFEAKAEDKS